MTSRKVIHDPTHADIYHAVGRVEQSVADLREELREAELPKRVRSLETSRAKSRGAMATLALVLTALGAERLMDWLR